MSETDICVDQLVLSENAGVNEALGNPPIVTVPGSSLESPTQTHLSGEQEQECVLVNVESAPPDFPM